MSLTTVAILNLVLAIVAIGALSAVVAWPLVVPRGEIRVAAPSPASRRRSEERRSASADRLDRPRPFCPCLGDCPRWCLGRPCLGDCPRSCLGRPCLGDCPRSCLGRPCLGDCPRSCLGRPCPGDCPRRVLGGPDWGTVPRRVSGGRVRAGLDFWGGFSLASLAGGPAWRRGVARLRGARLPGARASGRRASGATRGRRALHRPADLRLVVRVVAARDPARAEPGLHARRSGRPAATTSPGPRACRASRSCSLRSPSPSARSSPTTSRRS